MLSSPIPAITHFNDFLLVETSNLLSRPVLAAIADDQVSMANSETPLLNYQRDIAVVDAVWI